MTKQDPPSKVKASRSKRSIALATSTPAKIFISYSHRDSNALKKMQAHLATLKRAGTDVWVDEEILPGDEIDKAIPKALKQANIFVALVSSDYMASNYCYDIEYQYALGRRERRTMYVVAAIVRPCDWKRSTMARYKALPKDGKAVIEWAHQDKAYADIAEGIRAIVSEVNRGSLKPIGRNSRAPSANKRVASRPVRKSSRTAISPSKSTTTISTKAARRSTAKSAKTLKAAGARRAKTPRSKGKSA